MKLTTLTFATLIALSATASAEWMDGNTNTAGSGNAAGNADATTAGKGEGSGKGTGNAKGWGTGRGDADGEIDFAINFKGKARTDMDTKMSGEGSGNAQGTTTADAVGTGNSNGNVQGNATGYNDSNASGTPWNNQNKSYPYPMMQMPMNAPQMNAPAPWGNQMPQPMPQGYMPQGYMMPNMPMMYNPYSNYYAPAPMNGYRPPMPAQAMNNPYQAPNFQAIQQRMEQQRAQAEAFFKKMEAQRQAQLMAQQPKNTAVQPQQAENKAAEAPAAQAPVK